MYNTRQNKLCENHKKIIEMRSLSMSLKEQYDIMFSEYQLGVEHTKRYANVANWCLNLTFVGLGALLTATLNEESILIYKLICVYVIPIYIYIFGLNYIFTLYMIGNVEDYLCNIENKIKCFSVSNNIIGIDGWNTYISKKGNKLNFLVYSFLAIIFVLYPIASVFLGKFYTIYRGNINNFSSYPQWAISIEIILPFLLYSVYIIVSIYLVIKNISIRTQKVKGLS